MNQNLSSIHSDHAFPHYNFQPSNQIVTAACAFPPFCLTTVTLLGPGQKRTQNHVPSKHSPIAMAPTYEKTGEKLEEGSLRAVVPTEQKVDDNTVAYRVFYILIQMAYPFPIDRNEA